MVLTGDSCGLVWPITLRAPTRGDSRDVGILGQDDDAGALGSLGASTAATDGTCCAGGDTCGPNGVAIDCDGGTDNASGRCSDGDAETHLLFNFGGPCFGNPAVDSCANYLAEIHAPAKTTISLVPVGGTGHTSINGNEIVYATGGGTVELEIRLGTWDPDGTDERTFAWQVGLDPAGYTSALAGTLTPRSVPCTTDADCVPIFGGVCDVSGTRCIADGDCPPNETCGGLKCKKRFRADPVGSEICLPAYIMSDRSDYVFRGLPEAVAVDVESGRCSSSGRICTETGGCLFEPPQINETCVDGAFRWASALNGAFPILPPSPFPVEGLYAGTLQLDISPDAKGTFTLGLLPASGSVMLLASGDLSAPLVGLVPAKITIPAGQCCDAALSPLCASGTVTVGECSAQGGLFDPTKTCADVCECLSSSAAVPDRILNRNGVLVTSVKNRFLSFSGGDAGLMQAVRVSFVSLPGAFSVFDGTSLWVDMPRAASELPGKSLTDPVGTDASFQVAGFRATPLYIDWSGFGVVHVTDERIIPSRKRPSFPLEPAVYEIQIVTENCHTGTETNFSPALRITNARWADIGDSDGRAFLAPDGTVSVSDVLAIIAKFSSSDKAPIKARAELLGSGPNGSIGRVDGVISVSDLLEVLRAFSGGSYPFAPPE